MPKKITGFENKSDEFICTLINDMTLSEKQSAWNATNPTDKQRAYNEHFYRVHISFERGRYVVSSNHLAEINQRKQAA